MEICSNVNEEPFVTLKAEKKANILSYLKSDVKINKLKVFAMSRFGLVDNEVRCKVWMKLHNVSNKRSIFYQIDDYAVKNHKDYQQVLMDVNRSLKRFPPGMDDVIRMAMQDKLVDLIVKVLIAVKGVNYYQGFHDICVTFLLVLNEEDTFILICQLCKTHFIDFMTVNMDATMQLLYLIYAVIEQDNSKLIKKLQQVSLEPFFALSWVITWFGHVLGDIPKILRLYDFFLASDPIMPIYLSAAIVLHRHEEIDQTEADFAQLHHMLTNLPPTNRLPLEHLLTQTMELYLRHSPCSILTCTSLPNQLSLRLTNICSEILRNKRGPLGDAIESRICHNRGQVSTGSYIGGTNTASTSQMGRLPIISSTLGVMSNHIWLFGIFATLVVLVGYYMNYMLN